jgi:hypothetical protein
MPVESGLGLSLSVADDKKLPVAVNVFWSRYVTGPEKAARPPEAEDPEPTKLPDCAVKLSAVFLSQGYASTNAFWVPRV